MTPCVLVGSDGESKLGCSVRDGKATESSSIIELILCSHQHQQLITQVEIISETMYL